MAANKEYSNGHQGSELHRLKPMREGYDKVLFNKLYKICKPVIRNLAKQIDCKRFNLTRDIIESYFWDKMLFVFNKYYSTCSENHLQARILSSLTIFKNHLLKTAYGSMADYNQRLNRWDDLFDNSKEDPYPLEVELIEEDNKYKEYLYKLLEDYLRKHLSMDGYLVYEATYKRPEYITNALSKSSRDQVTNEMLLDFFELPKTQGNSRYIGSCKREVVYWLDRAKEELKA